MTRNPTHVPETLSTPQTTSALGPPHPGTICCLYCLMKDVSPLLLTHGILGEVVDGNLLTMMRELGLFPYFRRRRRMSKNILKLVLEKEFIRKKDELTLQILLLI